jgi:uncharacterized protein YdeI (YjbR/CyaY-like superfamily)
MKQTNSMVDALINSLDKWQTEFSTLRAIILQSELIETLKWGVPCYMLEEKNVVLIHGFKDYCALLFIKGSLLKDTNKILVQQTKNVQAGRQIRFTEVRQIVEMEPVLHAYLEEAIALEKSGIKVVMKSNVEWQYPEEFIHKLDENPALKTAFHGLTPGRQRAYLLHFSAPKQAKTRETRIEKCIPNILANKGLDDL